jgi:hypothetical protein
MQTLSDLPTLQWMLANRFNGLNGMTLRLGSKHHTGVDRLAVQQQRARSAFACLAAMLCAIIAQAAHDLKQAFTWKNVQPVNDTIYIETELHKDSRN